MNLALTRFVPSLLALCIAGCAGQITTQTGFSGSPVPAGAPVMVVASPAGMEDTNRLAQAAVAQALGQHGHPVSAEAPTRVEITIAERSAPIAVITVAGDEISSSRKKRKFWQPCAARIQRLTIAVYADGQPGVTRVWAEETHCKASLAKNLAALSQGAVALLERPELAGKTRRTGLN